MDARQGNRRRDLIATSHQGSFAEAFECLLGALKRGSTESLPIVILLDEFETFAQQPRQTLLYNLFDAAQSGKNPVLVIGLATQIVVLDGFVLFRPWLTNFSDPACRTFWNHWRNVSNPASAIAFYMFCQALTWMTLSKRGSVWRAQPPMRMQKIT